MARSDALLAIALVACAAPAPNRPTPAPPAPRPSDVPPTDAAPPPPVHARLLDAATARLSAERAAPIHDPALDAVAKVVAARAGTEYVVATGELRAALAAQLGTGLDPYVLTARGSDATIVAQLAPAIGELRGAAGIAAVGVAAVDVGAEHVAALVAMPPPASPIAIARDGAIVRLTVPWPWPEGPRAFDVTGASSRRIEVTPSASGAELTIDCDRTASRTVELEAGDRLVASVVNVCAPSPPVAAGTVEVGPVARTAVEIEQRTFEMINRDRVLAGLAALTWDTEAHALARYQAGRMDALDFVGHVAPDGETLPDRVAAARLPAIEAFENVGLADGPGRAHQAFMASPGHRHNLLAPRARRAAVGIAPSRREPGWFYVTEIFFEPR